MFRLLRHLTPLVLMALTAHSLSADTPTPKRVALVFDDGPTTEQCRRYIDFFAREGLHVTFSHVGEKVAAHPELARAVAQAGHEIANHSYTHPHFKDLSDEAIKQQLLDTQAVIQSATGHAPRLAWTPFLEWDDRIAAVHRAIGLKHMPLSHLRLVSSDDWNQKTDAAGILHNATTDIEDRTVILCHEWRTDTLSQMPAILAELRRQGCVFLTFSELAATLPPEQQAAIR